MDKIDQDNLIEILRLRFENNKSRHFDVKFDDFVSKLLKDQDKLYTVYQMEFTKGEPDVIGYDQTTDLYLVVDCSKETPLLRRSVCYDQEALESRKNFKPENSAIQMAKEIGIELLDENQYRALQKFGPFDTKTSSWLKTPKEIRDLGGAIFGDFRYNQVFIYHNGADSYYGVRGFRGIVKV
jgi:hypothetical protein